jgi:hypothetical protein
MSQSWPEAQDSVQPEQESPARRGTRQIWGAIAVLAVAVLAAGTVGFFLGRSSATPSPTDAASAQARLRTAYDACQNQAGSTLNLADGGASIVIDTGSEYGSVEGMDCILSELGTPESIQAQMGRTTAMMGVQDADSDGIEYSWSYHPDNGVDMVITDTRAGASN